MMMLFRWVINAAALLGIAYLVPGFFVEDIWAAIWAALVLGLVNAFLRPLLKILTFPITVVTLGLFSFVVNALLLWLVAALIPGFAIANIFAALLGAVILWVVSMVVNWLGDEGKKKSS